MASAAGGQSTCGICAYATGHLRWPMAVGTHCRDCHRSWNSTAQAHCTVCHQSFAGNSVADLHWREPRGHSPVHLDPSTIPRLELHAEAMGGVWRSTGDREPRQFGLYAERGDIAAPQCPDVVPKYLGSIPAACTSGVMMTDAITFYCDECGAPIEDPSGAVRWDPDIMCYLCAKWYAGSDDLMMVPDPTTLVADFEARMAAS